MAYVINELVKRLKQATDWLVRCATARLQCFVTALRADVSGGLQTVLKCLITIHRLMRESDVTFLEEVRLASAAAAESG